MLEELKEATVYQLAGCAEDWLTTHLKGFWGLRTDQTYQWMAINEGDYCLFYATRPEWVKAKGAEPNEGIIGMGKVAKKSEKTALEWISEIQAHVSSRPLLIHFSEIWWIGDVDRISHESMAEKIDRGDDYIAEDVRTLTEHAITVKELEAKGIHCLSDKSVAELRAGSEGLLELLVSRLAMSRFGIDWNEQDSFFAIWAYDMLDRDRQIDQAGLFRQVADLTGQSVEAMERKVRNVAFHDPRSDEEKPVDGAANQQILLARMFDWYWHDRQAARAHFRRLYQAALFGLHVPVMEYGRTDDRRMLAEEGLPGQDALVHKKAVVALLAREREYFRALDADNLLRCAACGFVTPDGITQEMVQLHHLEPIWETDEEGEAVAPADVVSRMVPLCPTCHALAHSERPPVPVERVRELRNAG